MQSFSLVNMHGRKWNKLKRGLSEVILLFIDRLNEQKQQVQAIQQRISTLHSFLQQPSLSPLPPPSSSSLSLTLSLAEVQEIVNTLVSKIMLNHAKSCYKNRQGRKKQNTCRINITIPSNPSNHNS